jgi:hypothetical protein
MFIANTPQFNVVAPRKQGAGLRNGSEADEWEQEWKIKFEKEWAKRRADLDAELLQDAKDSYMRMVKELANKLRVLEVDGNKRRQQYEALERQATPSEILEAKASADKGMLKLRQVYKRAIKKRGEFPFNMAIPEGSSKYFRELTGLAIHTKSIMSIRLQDNIAYYNFLFVGLEHIIKYRHLKSPISVAKKENSNAQSFKTKTTHFSTSNSVKKLKNGLVKVKDGVVKILVIIGLGGLVIWLLAQNKSEAQPNRKSKALMSDEKG